MKDVLSRVTGGANGRGEQMRSLTTDEQYTPSARTIRSLASICESATSL
jgi:hypothetical protein